MNLKQLSSVAALLLLAACAEPNLPQQNSWQAAEQVQDFSADGRLAVKVEGKGSYANFDWTYQNAVQTIDVNTPLGNTVGQLCQDGEGVLAVDSKGKVYQAETAEELSRQLLSFALPVQYLHIWSDGKRVANAPYKILPDGRLGLFRQQGSAVLTSAVVGHGLIDNPPGQTIRQGDAVRFLSFAELLN